MIVVWGKVEDAPVAAILQTLAETGTDHCHVDEQALSSMRWDIEFSIPPKGWLEVHRQRVAIQAISGFYLRPWHPAPGADGRATMTLLALAATLPCTVINRPAGGRSNASKPYQLDLIAQAGFDVPGTLVTSDEGAARAFLRRHGRLVYKSLSGVRSIVGVIDAGGEARLARVGTGPVQLQEYVDGLDVRVHVVGDRWFACGIRSSAIDYRYPTDSTEDPKLEAYNLPDAVGNRLARLAHGMGLVLAGIDLRLTPTGTWVCFEVNPSPGFTWYESATGHPIAKSVVDVLSGTNHTKPSPPSHRPSTSLVGSAKPY